MFSELQLENEERFCVCEIFARSNLIAEIQSILTPPKMSVLKTVFGQKHRQGLNFLKMLG